MCTCAETFYLAKGLIALTATCILLWHMFTTQGEMCLARVFRYLGLLSSAGLITYASTDQIRERVSEWSTVNSASFGTACIILLAAVLSILEDRGCTIYVWKRDRP